MSTFSSGRRQPRKVLVTGGSGFLGRQVVKVFQDAGHDVAAYDNNEAHCGAEKDFPAIPGDVTNFSKFKGLVTAVGFDTIIHLAAYGRNLTCQDFPQRAFDVNVNGTYNVLETARLLPNLVKRVVVCSSNIVLSDAPTVYRMTKNICEKLVQEYAFMGVSCLGLRPSNICGIGQSRKEYQPCAMAGLDIGFEKNGIFKITGDGTQARDFINVKDVARAFLLATESDITGITLDVCTGVSTSINQLAEIAGVPVEYVEARKGDAQILVSYPKEAEDFIGFKAEIGIEQTVQESFPAVMAAKWLNQ